MECECVECKIENCAQLILKQNFIIFHFLRNTDLFDRWALFAKTNMNGVEFSLMFPCYYFVTLTYI